MLGNNSDNDNNSVRTRKSSKAIILCIILAASAAVGVLIAVSNSTGYYYAIGSDAKKNPLQDQNAAIAATPSSTTTIVTSPSPTHREFTLVAEDADLQIAPGETVRAWTFNGTVPGPTLRFTEGDNVTIHFINKTPLAHTLHMHGNHDEKDDGVNPQVLPGQNYTYNFIADPAGAFMYHCHAYPTSLHIRMGMYGAIIVDPKDTTVLKPAREFSLVMSEYDPDNQNNFVAKYYPVNGYVDQYMDKNALQVKQNELVRFYVVNIGTTIPYSFHLHSTIFKVYQSGLISNPPIDAQTIEIGPGNTAIVEATWNSSGTYMFHSHGLMEERGNMGSVHVVAPDDGGSSSKLVKSISMIDSQYQLQKELQNPKIIDYGNSILGGAASPNATMPSHNHENHSDNGSSTEGVASSSNNNNATTVKIAKGAWDKNQKIAYSPADLLVKKGSTITWQNEDSVVHTVTSKQEGLFNSAMIAPSQEWQHELSEKGAYDYYCMVHPWMQGKVTVAD